MARQICRRPRGIFLVTGPTGSGKTTTLATMINYINENFDRHVITMEDLEALRRALRRALRQVRARARPKLCR